MHESTLAHTDSCLPPSLNIQNILDNAPIGIFTSTPEGRYISVNTAQARILGYETPENLIDSVTDIATQVYADPLDRGEFMRLMEEQSAVYNHEFRFRRRDGAEIWVSKNVRAIRDEDGQIVVYQGFNTDVTEWRKAEAQALHNARFFNSLLETVPIPVFQKDRDGRYQGFNKAFEEFSGKSREELVGKSVFDISAPDLAAIHHAKDTQLCENPGTMIYASKVKVAHDDVRDVIFHKATLTDEQGVVTGLIGAVLDISESKRNEEALLESEERFRLAMDAANDGLWDWNVETGRVYFSPGYWQILGYAPESVSEVVRSWQDLIHPDDRERVLEVNQRCIDGHISNFAVEYRMCTAAGDWIWILGRGKAIHRDSQGRALRMVGTHVDITERKQAEEERKKIHEQHIQAHKMETVGRLAGGVAHDFNNMLGVILGYSEMALEQVSPGHPMYKALFGIQQAAQRSADLTRQLLTFARKQTIAPKRINLNQKVEGGLKMLRRLIGEDIDLIWLPGRHLCPVKMDPTQIDQILANLCVNARDAIKDVGKITIETSNTVFDAEYCARNAGFLPGEYVLLAVSDNGCGMDRETINHLFEPFFTTKEQGQGTGLGLASVYGAVKQNKGFINVYSEPDQGTTFKIYLRAYVEKSVEEVEKVAELPAEQGNETILLVEDESAILEMTTMMLERLGYTVVAAATPGEAIRLAHEHSGFIDLLVTDVVMPEMNGRELAGKLITRYPDLKRLFMSGYTANVIAHHGVLDPGVHFIQKPFTMKDLGRKLGEALGRD